MRTRRRDCSLFVPPCPSPAPRLPLEVIEHILGLLYNDNYFVDPTYWSSLLSCILACHALARSGLVHLYAHIGIKSERGLKSLLSAQHYPHVSSRLSRTRRVTIVKSESTGRWVERIPLLLTWLCPNITELVLCRIDFAYFCTSSNRLLRALECLSNVKHLTLRSCEFHNLAQLQRIIRAFPSLMHLYLAFQAGFRVPPGRLQSGYLSPALVTVVLDQSSQYLPLMKWLLGGPNMRALTLGILLDGDTIMECLGSTAPCIESLKVWLSDEDDEHKISLSGCEKLRTLTLVDAVEPHVLLATLPSRSTLCSLELHVWGSEVVPDWGKLACALQVPQLAMLQHVAVRAYYIRDKKAHARVTQGTGETTLHELRDQLRNNGLDVTIFVTEQEARHPLQYHF